MFQTTSGRSFYRASRALLRRLEHGDVPQAPEKPPEPRRTAHAAARQQLRDAPHDQLRRLGLRRTAVQARRQDVGQAERRADAGRDAAARVRQLLAPWPALVRAGRPRPARSAPRSAGPAPPHRRAPPAASRHGCASPPGTRTARGPPRGSARRAGMPRRRPTSGRSRGPRRSGRSSRRPASRTAPSCRATAAAGRASASATSRAPARPGSSVVRRDDDGPGPRDLVDRALDPHTGQARQADADGPRQCAHPRRDVDRRSASSVAALRSR